MAFECDVAAGTRPSRAQLRSAIRDAVPSGVAVEEPIALDETAETAPESPNSLAPARHGSQVVSDTAPSPGRNRPRGSTFLLRRFTVLSRMLAL